VNEVAVVQASKSGTPTWFDITTVEDLRFLVYPGLSWAGSPDDVHVLIWPKGLQESLRQGIGYGSTAFPATAGPNGDVFVQIADCAGAINGKEPVVASIQLLNGGGSATWQKYFGGPPFGPFGDVGGSGWFIGVPADALKVSPFDGTGRPVSYPAVIDVPDGGVTIVQFNAPVLAH
jgi:hypothetical protein